MERISEELRRRMIAEAAYFRAEHRGFEGGDPIADWLDAEAEIDTRLGNGRSKIGSLDERLAATNLRLKELRKRFSTMTSTARREWQDDIETLARYRDRLRKHLKEAREETGHTAEKAKARAERVWRDVSSHMENLSRRLRRDS